MIILVISGWGITHTEIVYRLSLGLMDRRLANAIHRAINFPLAILFLTHVLANIRLRLPVRYLTRKWLVDIILITIGVSILLVALYMEYLV